MSTQVTMDDGTEMSLMDHLREAHHKGTRGLKDDFLRTLHQTLHQRSGEAEMEHQHLGDEAGGADDVPGGMADGEVPGTIGSHERHEAREA
ncbi:MAG TPA: hypothetical protein VGG75_36210 [Trebonia sp.]